MLRALIAALLLASPAFAADEHRNPDFVGAARECTSATHGLETMDSRGATVLTYVSTASGLVEIWHLPDLPTNDRTRPNVAVAVMRGAEVPPGERFCVLFVGVMTTPDAPVKPSRLLDVERRLSPPASEPQTSR